VLFETLEFVQPDFHRLNTFTITRPKTNSDKVLKEYVRPVTLASGALEIGLLLLLDEIG